MNTAIRLRFNKTTMWVDLSDGRQLGVPLAYFPRLLKATPKQRNDYVISGGGVGLHWEKINEDISVPAILMGIGDRTSYKLLSSAGNSGQNTALQSKK